VICNHQAQPLSRVGPQKRRSKRRFVQLKHVMSIAPLASPKALVMRVKLSFDDRIPLDELQRCFCIVKVTLAVNGILLLSTCCNTRRCAFSMLFP